MAAQVGTSGNSRLISIPAPRDVDIGEVVQIGRLFGVTVTGALAGNPVNLATEGVAAFDKNVGEEIQTGMSLYWNESLGVVDTTRDAIDKPAIGWAVEDALALAETVNVALTPSVQLFPVVGSFTVQRGIDTSPKSIADPLCEPEAQVVLTPIDGAAAAVPFWAIAGDGSFDVHWTDDPNAYASVNADGSSNAATTTPVVIDLIEDEGSLNFDVDVVADTVTFQYAGLYDFRLNMNGTATRNITYIFRARVNGAPVGQPTEFVMSGNIDDFAFSDNGFFSLNAGDVVDFTVETASGSGTINFNQWSISLLRAGTTTPEWVSAGFKYLVIGPPRWDTP